MKTETFASFDGTQLALHRIGAGPPVVLLHGLFSNADTNWIRFGHAALIAAQGYEVIMPDLRAHGHSAAPHEASAFPKDVLVRDTAALVAHLGVSDYDLGGFSLGARTVLHGVGGGILSPKRLVVCGMGVEGLSDWVRRSAFFKRVIDDFDTIERGAPEYFARQFLKTQGIDRIAARHLLDAMTDMPLGELANVTMPAQIVCGDEDQDNGSARDLAAMLPNAVYTEIPGTHMSCVTKPDLGQAIADWLGPAAA